MRHARISLLVLMAFLSIFSMTPFTGCGGGGNRVEPTPTVDVTGTWSGTYSTSLVPSGSITLNLTQSDADVTGTYITTEGNAGTVNGTVSGNTLNFTFTQTTPSCTGTFSGTATINGNTATFTFTGSDCLGSHTNGQGDATKGVNLTGSWSGSWASSNGIDHGNVSAALIQSGTSVSGTESITESPCISGGSVSGTVSGNNVSFGVVSGPDTVTYTATYTSTSMSGTYSVTTGACTGDAGTFSMNK